VCGFCTEKIWIFGVVRGWCDLLVLESQVSDLTMYEFGRNVQKIVTEKGVELDF
jgi:hypothetical protein